MTATLVSPPAVTAATPVETILRDWGADPARTVLVDHDREIAAGDARAAVLGHLAALRRAGVAAGDTVAVLTRPNAPVMIFARYAAALLGAAVVHIRSMNPRADGTSLSAGTQADVINLAGVSVLVVDHVSADRALDLRARVPGLAVLLDPPAAEGVDALPAVDPDLPAAIDFTSGSTSEPKMVQHTFRSRQVQIERLRRSYAEGPPPVMLAVTPISHTLAPMVDAVLASHGSVVLHEVFCTGLVNDTVAARQVSDLYLAVPQLYALLDQPVPAEDRRSLRRVVYSGTPIAPHRVGEALAYFGDVLTQVYGATETAGIASLTGLDHYEPELHATVGRPFPWVRLEVRDPESRVVRGRGEVGEIWVHSPTLMTGYLGCPDRTSPFDDAGWLRTGDLGLVDDFGYLRLVGRVGAVIKSGGLKLHPGLIEQTLLAHPLVRHAIVFGVRDADYVEHVHAAVELRDPTVSEAELAEHVTRALSSDHTPAEIRRWARIPLTESGKPDYARLRRGDHRP